MTHVSRRSVLGGSVGLAAAGVLPAPHIARAEAVTASMWQTQGFVPAEDAAIRSVVADYQKASGNKIELTITPFMALMQKTVSALTGGDVPDVISMDAPDTLLSQNAWEDKLLDVSDVVETQKSALSESALQYCHVYNNATKKRAYYFVPYKMSAIPFHIWGSLVEKAGFNLAEAPKTWDAFWDFFKPMQAKLRAKGMRRVYALGMQLTTVGPNDGNGVFHGFLIANGGKDIVTADGKLHIDDPKVREAAIKSITYMTNSFKEGYVPPDALSWNDADDNNAFHEKLMVMDFDGTISTELALYDNKDLYLKEMVTLGLPLGNDGAPIPAQVGAGGGFIPKGAKNVAVAKDFLKYVVQPKVQSEYLKHGLGRWVPAAPATVKEDPWWLDPSDPHRAPYVTETLLGPTMPVYNAFNPAWGRVAAEQLWGQAFAAVVKDGAAPEAAIDKAFKRAEAIFAQYPIALS